MVAPPSGTHSLEGDHQGFNGGDGQDGGLGARFGGEVGTGDGDVDDEAREDFDLAVTDVPRETGEPRELERPAEKGMTGIGDGDLTLAFLRDQRGITSVEVCRSPALRPAAVLAAIEAVLREHRALGLSPVSPDRGRTEVLPGRVVRAIPLGLFVAALLPHL